MKNLRAYITISLVLLSNALFACWTPAPVPNNNMIYRLMEDVSGYYRYDATPFLDPANNRYQDYTFRTENLKLWKEQTRAKVDKAELERIVYKSTFKEIKEHRSYCEGILGKEAFKFLCLAKECEELRAELNDPWYYPSKEDPTTDNLARVAKKAMAYKGRTWINRYALQAIRALVSLKQDSIAVRYWESIATKMNDDVIRIMAERHVAAAYYAIGERDKAMHIYAKAGDITSMYYIYQRECEDPYGHPLGRNGRVDIIRYVYEECPNSPFFKDVLQSILTHFDNDHFQKRHDTWCSREKQDELNLINGIISVGNRAVRDDRVEDKAMWHYTMAALYDAKGEYSNALHQIAVGVKVCKEGSFMANSFRVLRMMVEARTSPYNAKYIERLATDVRWLSDLASKNITPKLKKELYPHVVHTKWGRYTPDIEYYNKMYWSDAMNRILADCLAPRLKKEERITDALLVSNLGEYWLPKNVYGTARIKNNDGIYSVTDLSNTMATMADSCSSTQIIRMYKRLCHPANSFDKIVAEYGKTDVSYWSDIIGTHCIAEHKYEEAAKWLKSCSHTYQKSMSTWDYFNRDPFCLKIGWYQDNRHHLKDRYDYKLNYANRMAQLGKQMNKGNTKDLRAEAMILYGVGLRNQSDWCWALSRNIDFLYDHDDLIDTLGSKKWINKGLALMQDKERKAYYLHAFGRNKEVQDLCFDTKIAKNMRAHCDLWRDYKKK